MARSAEYSNEKKFINFILNCDLKKIKEIEKLVNYRKTELEKNERVNYIKINLKLKGNFKDCIMDFDSVTIKKCNDQYKTKSITKECSISFLKRNIKYILKIVNEHGDFYRYSIIFQNKYIKLSSSTGLNNRSIINKLDDYHVVTIDILQNDELNKFINTNFQNIFSAIKKYNIIEGTQYDIDTLKKLLAYSIEIIN